MEYVFCAVGTFVGVLQLRVAYNLSKTVSNGSCNVFKTFLNVVYYLWCFFCMILKKIFLETNTI